MMKDMFVHASNFDSQEKNENELYVPVICPSKYPT